MHLAICAIGRFKNTPLEEAFLFYQRRLTWSLLVVELTSKVPPSADVKTRRQQDMALLLQSVPAGFQPILLDPSGKETSSEALAELLASFQNQSISPAFLIGGAEGLEIADQKNSQKQPLRRLAFGTATWPHLLMRVMLVEQLYRAQQILKNHPYHKT